MKFSELFDNDSLIDITAVENNGRFLRKRISTEMDIWHTNKNRESVVAYFDSPLIRLAFIEGLTKEIYCMWFPRDKRMFGQRTRYIRIPDVWTRLPVSDGYELASKYNRKDSHIIDRKVWNKLPSIIFAIKIAEKKSDDR